MPTPAIRYGKNLRGIRRDADYTRQATRLVGRGGSGDDSFTIRNATWPITAIDTSTGKITFGETPIAYDRQLDDLLVQVPGTYTYYGISNTLVADQSVVLTATDGLSVGQRVHIRRRGLCAADEGGDLTWLDHPERRDDYGVWEALIVAEDLPPIDNEAPNPFFNDWTESPPGTWTPTGYAIDGQSAKETDPTRARYGTASWAFELAAGAHELTGPWMPVSPTGDSPYFSLAVAIQMKLGVVNLFLDCDTVGDGVSPGDGKVVRIPTAQSGRAAYTGGIGVWETLGIIGANLYDNPGGADPLAVAGTKRVRLAIAAASGTTLAQGWLDAVQFTQAQSGVDTFYGYRASNQLWHRLNDAFTLGNYADPELGYDVKFLDYYRGNPAAYPAEALAEGQRVTVVDAPLGITAQPLVSDLSRDLTPGGAYVTDAEFRTIRRDFTRRTYNRDRSLLPAPAAPAPGSTSAPPAAATGGALTLVAARIVLAVEGNDWVYLSWHHNSVVQANAGGRFSLTIDTSIYGQVCLNRDPRLEWPDADSIAGEGGFRYVIQLGGDILWTDVIQVYLIDAQSAANPVATYPVTVEDFFYVP